MAKPKAERSSLTVTVYFNVTPTMLSIKLPPLSMSSVSLFKPLGAVEDDLVALLC